MNKNTKIAEELVKIAKSLVAINILDNDTQLKLDRANNENKKYILHHQENGLWRIMACKNFSVQGKVVTKGDFGGLIEKEENLSHEGGCWVYDNAQVYGNAQVFDNAIICDNAQVFENAVIQGEVNICGKTQIYGNSCILGDSLIKGSLLIHGKGIASGRAN